MGRVIQLEPWLTKREIADRFRVSVRWIEGRLSEGLPSAMIAGRRKFRFSEVEDWLDQHGHIRRDDAAS